jgi:hypothetical protein
MVKYFFLFLFFLFLNNNTLSANLTLKDKIKKATQGDFVVTYKNKTYTLLLVQKSNAESIILSEISIPKNKITFKKNFSWKKWIDEDAPNNISFHIYEVDLNKNKIVKCFSISQNKWIFLSDSFFYKLLSLPLKKLSLEKRKKIGPEPLNEEMDKRTIWSPPMIIDKKKRKKAKFDVFRTKWPKDASSLSSKVIYLYFDAQSDFPFPFWIELSTGNFDIMLKVVDSGKGLTLKKNFEEKLH